MSYAPVGTAGVEPASRPYQDRTLTVEIRAVVAFRMAKRRRWKLRHQPPPHSDDVRDHLSPPVLCVFRVPEDPESNQKEHLEFCVSAYDHRDGQWLDEQLGYERILAWTPIPDLPDDFQDWCRTYLEEERTRDVRLDCSSARAAPALPEAA